MEMESCVRCNSIYEHVIFTLTRQEIILSKIRLVIFFCRFVCLRDMQCVQIIFAS